ncbi:MAG: GFA family protein [Aquamicrobium sp.]|jgi:hypothetical protein|uniref:GFA family protein n=1 Tax=Mesorhizobium TaxID=68287 RepID=UPI0010138349|nr:MULTISPECIES: GFA family protein [Mesorhizobium]MBR2690868.1 GFA family protein [Aquamicrobium sp.]QAZ43429.1 GFA family protein [Mesorhizobium sp. Pch-S]
MKIDGSCYCGAIAYEAEVDPNATLICHCTDCQQLTGTAFRVSLPTPEAQFRLTKGEPKIFEKTGSSGAKRLQAFCGDCGSHLYVVGAGDGPKIYGIRTGTARQRQDLVPRLEKFHGSALGWMPRFESVETTIEGQ